MTYYEQTIGSKTISIESLDDKFEIFLETGDLSEYMAVTMTREQAYAFYKGMHTALFGELPEWVPTRGTR